MLGRVLNKTLSKRFSGVLATQVRTFAFDKDKTFTREELKSKNWKLDYGSDVFITKVINKNNSITNGPTNPTPGNTLKKHLLSKFHLIL